ncbi:hypothetical protein MDA_GLEAN10019258 [Myotis davidii]|uniref:Uncharacterized protein n=1 Tax=Myotis davidii TaxID=225400 RepID=L5LJL4_MYODS|nr:hypothetical protein MDA_GLEAN10019258 [Myotis davidii]
MEDPAGHALRASAKVAGDDTISLSSSIDLGHGANPSASLKVQELRCGSSSCVEPILIVGSKLIMLGQLDSVQSLRDFELSGLFEEGCQSSDELLLVHVFYSNGMEDPAGHALRASAKVAGDDTISLSSSIDLGHGANPSASLKVQELRCGSSSCVEPILIVGSKLLEPHWPGCFWVFRSTLVLRLYSRTSSTVRAHGGCHRRHCRWKAGPFSTAHCPPP